MDSWSRPSKHAATPPPLYLTTQGETVPYCHTCGRLITPRKSQSNAAHATPVKYCSDRCRHQKVGPIDRKIEVAFIALLNGSSLSSINPEIDLPTVPPPIEPSTQARNKKSKKKKGDPRLIILCSEVETAVFGSRQDPEKVFGRRKNRARRGVVDEGEWRSVDMVDQPSLGKAEGYADNEENSSESDDPEGNIDIANADTTDIDKDYVHFGGGKVRAPQSQAEVNGSVGGEKGWAERNDETTEMLKKRRAGQRRAEEKEMVKRAARRGCAFGFVVESMDVTGAGAEQSGKRRGRMDGPETASSEKAHRKRKCEAVMHGVAVEPSFAKGDWALRWREDEVGDDSAAG